MTSHATPNPQNDWKLPWEGGCRCNQVRLRISAPPLLTMACHCSGCQRMSASAFSLSVAIPAAGFEVTAGEPVLGGLQQGQQHFFCPHCKSWMFTRIEGMADFVNVRAPMLDHHEWYAPFAETWTDEKLPWASTSAKYSYPQFPPMEDFPKLMQEFAQEGARPSQS